MAKMANSAPLHVIILAAGQGSRMKSRHPKVMHPLAGVPLLHHVIASARALQAQGIHVVVGHGAEAVREATPDRDLHWAHQDQQLGTGHAVAQALPQVPDEARVLVLYGDVPLTRPATLTSLTDQVDEQTLALLTVDLPDPAGYGRIIRNPDGQVSAIVEQKDATAEQQRIREVNSGILAASARHLKRWLPALSAENAQGEYYLTDIIAMASSEQMAVAVTQPETPEEVQGINNRIQLAALERYYQQQQAIRLMTAGVTLADPARIDVRGTLNAAGDVSIDPGCLFEGDVELGEGVQIGAHCVIRNATLGPGTRVEPHSLIDGAQIEGPASIGPFARLRPGTRIAAGGKVGNFVETKNARIGEGSKVNHLSYIGDAELGKGVNVGAGTITCNYDGVNKHRTEIGDGCFIGSNTSLVAPLTLGAGSTTGAGSTITKEVAEGELAIGRARQRNISHWSRPGKKDH
ncbi:MAG: bifunctional UDP-N-acetylglucosamine diphosphorylase/glucosamine-1-phosphate N-acetyltransferase GlmU [Oleiphilaceae bacterium]|nr:bifunctional UDP-N-acetylglucosamine diphosphorylase/glucosamine-1-phosphate N-acetyltransferase GlmU [Oleiphilaceae bacterium]